jgi:signal transduction histidine kinase
VQVVNSHALGKAMAIDFSGRKLESDLTSDIQTFCQLQAKQLVNHSPIFFARIIYHNCLLKVHQEVITYTNNQLQFSSKILAYLRSEEWLTEFPTALTVNEFRLKDLELICYICPLGYKNQKPEYIQIITDEPLSESLQQYVKQSAMLLSKYADIYWECGRQKSEIKLLEHILHKVGHQLRNSLALIGLYAHNLSLGLQDNVWQQQATIIRESIENLNNNLTELIDCGQGTKLKIAPQDLRSLVAESIKGLEPLVEQKQLKISIPNTSTTLTMDRLQMKQVFDNILSNAIHFSPHSGTITCSWQIFQEEVLIKISDQGVGLSQEDIQKIFTPFYSRRKGGIGLGLTIAKKIILDHQGNLWAQSVVKGGAQFLITLPRLNKAHVQKA